MELRWSDIGNSLFAEGSFKLGLIPAADRRRSDTDTRPMLDPRDGRGELLVLTEVGAAPGEMGWGRLRWGRVDEEDEEREGGSEFKSGGILL